MTTSATVRTVLVALLTVLGVLFAVYLLYRLEGIIQLIVLAVFLALALNPAVNALHGRRVPRTAAILAVFLAVVVGLLIVVTLALPSLIAQVQGIAHVLQEPGGLTKQLQRLGMLGALIAIPVAEILRLVVAELLASRPSTAASGEGRVVGVAAAPASGGARAGRP
jgi:predicted PurR-regulated permease PerM